MKYYMFLFVGLSFLFSCNNPSIISKFKPQSYEVQKGESTNLEWEVENADHIVIREQDKNEPLYASNELKGALAVTPIKNSVYNLLAYQNDDYILAECVVTVIENDKKIDSISQSMNNKIDSNILIVKKTEDDSSDNETYIKPQVESKINYSISPTVVGRKSFDNISPNMKLIYEIFYIEQSKYPQEIKLYVTVKDEYGNFIMNLAPPYGSRARAEKYFLQLVEQVEGVEYELDYFNVEERHDSLAQAYDFSLVLDHSGSMSNDINIVQSSAQEFINSMNFLDEASIIKFDDYIEKTVPLTTDRTLLLDPNIYNGLYGFGRSTALIAAADEGIRSFTSSNDSKIEILFTDGLENSSFGASLNSAISNQKPLAFMPYQLINNAREKNVKIIAIGYGDVDKDFLEQLSSYTGGKFYYAKYSQEINQIFNELPRLFQNYYVITYKPHIQDGIHTISLVGNANNGTKCLTLKEFIIGPIPIVSGIKMNRQRIASFDFDKDSVKVEDLGLIVKIANYMAKYPNSTITFYGHTDLSGSETENLDLSKRRAENVAKKFNQLGIRMERISIVPMGMSEPIYNPDAEDFQSKENRRVEFIIEI